MKQSKKYIGINTDCEEYFQMMKNAIEDEIKRTKDLMKLALEQKDKQLYRMLKIHLNKRYNKLDFYVQKLGKEKIRSSYVRMPKGYLSENQKRLVEMYYGKLNTRELLKKVRANFYSVNLYINKLKELGEV